MSKGKFASITLKEKKEISDDDDGDEKVKRKTFTIAEYESISLRNDDDDHHDSCGVICGQYKHKYLWLINIKCSPNVYMYVVCWCVNIYVYIQS